jgi:hypothetical protein
MKHFRLQRRYRKLCAARIYLELCEREPEKFALSAGKMISRLLMHFHAPVHEWKGFACGTNACDAEKREEQVKRSAI